MLKTLSALLLLTLPAFGQIGNFGDPAWFGTVATPAATSAFSPSDLAGLQLWLKASSGCYTDAGTTPCANNGNLVYQWNDLSGNGNHITQTDSGMRPYWTNTALLNNKQAVRFLGSDESMGKASALAVTNVTIFGVLWTSSGQDGGGDTWAISKGEDPKYLFRSRLYATARFTFYDYAYAGEADLQGTALMFCATDDGASFTVRTNSAQLFSVASGAENSFWGSGFGLGANVMYGGYYTDCLWSEFLVYNRVLTGDEIAKVETYLSQYLP